MYAKLSDLDEIEEGPQQTEPETSLQAGGRPGRACSACSSQLSFFKAKRTCSSCTLRFCAACVTRRHHTVTKPAALPVCDSCFLICCAKKCGARCTQLLPTRELRALCLHRVDTATFNSHDQVTGALLEWAQAQPVPGQQAPSQELALDQAQERKVQGNVRFRAGEYVAASEAYVECLRCLTGLPMRGPGSADLDSSKKQVALAAHLNLAVCYLRLSKFPEVILECTRALEIDPANVKAHFRRGRAQHQRGETRLAKADLQAALQLAPNNAEIRRELLEASASKAFKFDHTVRSSDHAVGATGGAGEGEDGEARTMRSVVPHPAEAAEAPPRTASRAQPVACSFTALSSAANAELPQLPPPSCALTCIKVSQAFKEKGNSLFTMQKFAEAITQYTLCVKYLADSEVEATVECGTVEEVQQAKNLRIACHLNMSACYTAARNPEQAIQEAEKALALEPGHKKGCYRLGIAYASIAQVHLRKAFVQDPEDKQLQKKLLLLDGLLENPSHK
ncbi:hypothetical protein CYMTET_25467 [Cymbomonas tetramitiformis]|uniref:Uncharacterized protein n=1 Tax=Cymbomonas tetramitiformis TaxID=36881 RepID=A0AAE0KZ55_9CHLO|nr:hypothetical protein CYMTET_25467 [Cymbomonas tetramitiformis]